MSRILTLFLLVIFLLTACAPSATLVPTKPPTNTPPPTATNTLISTATPSPTLEPWMKSLPDDGLIVNRGTEGIVANDTEGNEKYRWDSEHGIWERVVEDLWTLSESGLWTNPSEMLIYGEVMEVNPEHEVDVVELGQKLIYFVHKAAGHPQFGQYPTFESWKQAVDSGQFTEIENVLLVDRNQKPNMGYTGIVKESGETVEVKEIGMRVMEYDLEKEWNMLDGGGLRHRYAITIEKINGKRIFVLNIAGLGVEDVKKEGIVCFALSSDKTREENTQVLNQFFAIRREQIKRGLEDFGNGAKPYYKDNNLLTFIPQTTGMGRADMTGLSIEEWME